MNTENVSVWADSTPAPRRIRPRRKRGYVARFGKRASRHASRARHETLFPFDPPRRTKLAQRLKRWTERLQLVASCSAGILILAAYVLCLLQMAGKV